MDGDAVVGLSVVFAIIVVIASIIYSLNRQSQGYYDNYGRKIPLDDLQKQKAEQQEEMIRLKEQLETEKQYSSTVTQRLEQLEKRVEALEKRGTP